MAERYVCIHGHFYQPPRENPWLETIELQDSASPYHDWNERIAVECYAPNACARLLDGEGRIERLVNNYLRISFNIGPTLLSWLEQNAAETYAAILAADAESLRRYAGHGCAIAQAYNHLILPLANRRDKETQVIWGIRDFERRFGRRPEGMWLPETAVDVETLEVLAAHGVRYTILSPYQAQRVREIAGGDWRDVDGGRIDPTCAYQAKLPGNKQIALFFYDGPISRAVAFERLLEDGVGFAGRLLSGFSDDRQEPQLMHIATDGESYGHHHAHGEMALASALQHIDSNGHARLTNYGEFLELHPPKIEVEIIERTAWSCVHGLGRWERDCGCNSGGRPGWNQAWRQPLRSALDWLRDEVAPRFEQAAGALLKDPWAARNDYIDVLLDPAPESVNGFLRRHARAAPTPDGKPRLLQLMELQRHALLMYTSCGWFFDELSGIETTQVMQYAARVAQLARELFEADPEPGFLERLAAAGSNIAENGDGRRVYEKFVRPVAVDLLKVAAHYAMSSLFEEYGEETIIFGYVLRRETSELLTAGRVRCAIGRVQVTSRATAAAGVVSYAVLHQGDHNLTGGVRTFQGAEAYAALRDECVKLFRVADLPEMVRFLDREFAASTYSLRSLFREEQRRILGVILSEHLRQAEATHREIHDTHAPLLRVLADLHIPLPRSFVASVEFVLNTDLRRAFESKTPDLDRIRQLLSEAADWTGVELDSPRLAYAARRAIERGMEAVGLDPQQSDRMTRLAQLVTVCGSAPFHVDLARAQNLYDQLRRRVRTELASHPAEVPLRDWMQAFDALGRELGFRVAQ